MSILPAKLHYVTIISTMCAFSLSFHSTLWFSLGLNEHTKEVLMSTNQIKENRKPIKSFLS